MSNAEKAVKSAYLTAEERKLSKIAALQLDYGTAEAFYGAALTWFLGVHKDFYLEFAKHPEATCTSIWMTNDLSRKIDRVVKKKGGSAGNFMHTAIVLFLEKHGYLEDKFTIDWPGKDK